MMYKITKNISQFFIWLAMLTILGHGIIPHHHHQGLEATHQSCKLTYEVEEEPCHHDHDHSIFHHNTEKNEQCDDCHFKTEFAVNKHNLSFDYSPFTNQNWQYSFMPVLKKIEFNNHHQPCLYSYQDHQYTRGPPSLA